MKVRRPSNHQQETEAMPYKLCPSALAPRRRPRPFYKDWLLSSSPEANILQKEGLAEVMLKEMPVPVRSFLRGDEVVHEKFAGFPCFMRALRESHRLWLPEASKSTGSSDQEALRRCSGLLQAWAEKRVLLLATASATAGHALVGRRRVQS